jgi:hypothetical protein
MRLSASRIRSINRAIARVQKFAWSTSDRNRRRSIPSLTSAAALSATPVVKVVAVPRSVAR